MAVLRAPGALACRRGAGQGRLGTQVGAGLRVVGTGLRAPEGQPQRDPDEGDQERNGQQNVGPDNRGQGVLLTSAGSRSAGLPMLLSKPGRLLAAVGSASAVPMNPADGKAARVPAPPWRAEPPPPQSSRTVSGVPGSKSCLS